MKKLILKFIVFVLLLSSVILLSYLMISNVINKKANFELKKPVRNIVLGNSHTEFALNDSIITDFANISQSGESYFYTYIKLKKILEDNDQIQTVFIAYSNEVIDIGMNEWIWGDQFISFQFSKYSPFMDFQQHYILGFNNPKSYIENLSNSIKKNFVKILKNNYLFLNDNIGAFKNLNQDKENSEGTNVNPPNVKKIELSLRNLAYLDKIVDFCDNNKIELIFIRCPLHPNYQGFYNESEFKHILKNKYSRIRFLDFAKFQLEPTDYFDKEHLNYKGSEKFSIWFETYKNKELKSLIK